MFNYNEVNKNEIMATKKLECSIIIIRKNQANRKKQVRMQMQGIPYYIPQKYKKS